MGRTYDTFSFLTDYGHQDEFVGVVKSVIRGLAPHAAVIEAFDDADLFAWPGLREPIGMVYLEAQARGLPIVACDSLGVPDVVRDGETGLLAPEWDLPGLSGRIGALIDNADLRERLGAAGRQSVLARHGLRQASATLDAGVEAAISGGRR